MRYISTRGQADPKSFTDILLEGISPDGGLYLPESYPSLSSERQAELKEILSSDGYAKFASEIMKLFIDDIEPGKLEQLAAQAYNSTNFSDPDIVPLTHFHYQGHSLSLAHLSYGPTAAFKDMAMQMLGQLFEYELGRRHEQLTILGATSGDTGSSAEYAMQGKRSVKVVMLTPKGRMSSFQQAQMFSIQDPNIINVAVDGVFDDCQDLVKSVMADTNFKDKYKVGAVNSINWARVLAQVVYHIAIVLRSGAKPSKPINVVVPTGNFGNILAGFIAKKMGLPIAKLVVATNENDVLYEFFSTGRYKIRDAAHTLATSSPSMDISKASNLERIIFEALDRDSSRVRDIFSQLRDTGEFDLSTSDAYRKLQEEFGFISGRSTHNNRLETIRGIWDECNLLIDPHTADGVYVASRILAEQKITDPVVCLETALPVKFAPTILEAINSLPPVPEKFRGLEELPRTVIDCDNDVNAVKQIIVSHFG